MMGGGFSQLWVYIISHIYRGKGCISELSVEGHQPYIGGVVEDKVGDIS